MADGKGEASPFRKYLFGELPDSEVEQLERGYFDQALGPQRVDEIWAVFGEIAEEYLSGALPENDARRFELRLQSAPGLRKMFENEKALFAYATRNAAGAPRSIPIDNSITESKWALRWPRALSFNPAWPAWLAVTAGVALIALLAWGAFRNLSSNPESQQQANVKNQKMPSQATTPTVTSQSPQPGTIRQDDQLAKDESSSKSSPERGKSASTANRDASIAFLLLAAGERSGQSRPSLEIPAQMDIVKLDLELADDNCLVYSAELRSEFNESLRSWSNLRARRDPSTMRLVSARLEASLLKNANYVIRLYCSSNPATPVFIRDYEFKAQMK